MQATSTPRNLQAIDLTSLPEPNASALRREAIRRGQTLQDYLAHVVIEKSESLVTPQALPPVEVISTIPAPLDRVVRVAEPE